MHGAIPEFVKFFLMTKHINMLIRTHSSQVPTFHRDWETKALHLSRLTLKQNKTKVSSTLEKDISLTAKLVRGWEKIHIFSTHFKRVEKA